MLTAFGAKALDWDVALWVLLAAALHATWNAVVKTGSDRLLTQSVVIGTGGLLGLLFVPFVPLPLPQAWPFLALSVVAHTGYYVFLVQGYEHGDLSLVYPVARGIAPLLVSVLALVLVGEALGPVPLAGVALVSTGIASLGLFGRGAGPGAARSLIFASITGLFIASYTLVDGVGVRRAGSPAGYIAWVFLLQGVPMMAIALWKRRGRIARFLAQEWRPGVFGGAIATLGYAIVIWAMNQSGLAYVASLRETSVIIAALIGTRLLGESARGLRLAAAACVVAGNVLLHLF